jgi:hypothetical protein
VMTRVDLGLTIVSRFDSVDSVISVNDVNWKPGASHTLCYLILVLILALLFFCS